MIKEPKFHKILSLLSRNDLNRLAVLHCKMEMPFEVDRKSIEDVIYKNHAENQLLRVAIADMLVLILDINVLDKEEG